MSSEGFFFYQSCQEIKLLLRPSVRLGSLNLLRFHYRDKPPDFLLFFFSLLHTKQNAKTIYHTLYYLRIFRYSCLQQRT